MKKTALLFYLLIGLGFAAFSHSVDYSNVVLRQWNIAAQHKTVEGTFYMVKDDAVYIETADHQIVHYPLSSLSEADRDFALKKYEGIKRLNNVVPIKSNTTALDDTNFNTRAMIAALLLAVLAALALVFIDKKKLKYAYPILAVGAVTILYSFTSKWAQSTTDPATVDAAFVPFKPKVYTHWDNTWFYVECQGIADHEMMAGIVSWQQQVPIPQCYTGSNTWMIPLNPVVANTPVPVNPQHFTRGAVALAVNGVPIFNPYTNTGVDALVDGQLDNFGGHSGRGDDYHYHIAPLSLYSQTSATLPIAYALDGFAVYGPSEPDGQPMQTLDANHGHYGSDNVYHYHGTSTFPYMIGNMVGQVTEDTTKQIIPQPHANPMRPALTPLQGAVITHCVPNGTNNGYILTYTRNGQTYYVDYSWTPNGQYTFNFISPTDTVTENYNGFVQCEIPLLVNDVAADKNVLIYPNPSNGLINLQLSKLVKENDVKNIAVYNQMGMLVYNANNYKQVVDFKGVSAGTYIVKITLPNYQLTKKLIVQ